MFGLHSDACDYCASLMRRAKLIGPPDSNLQILTLADTMLLPGHIHTWDRPKEGTGDNGHYPKDTDNTAT